MKTEVKTIADGKANVVSLEGEIDFSVLGDLRQAIEEAAASKPPCLLVDLSAVSFIASDGLGVLIEANRQADSEGRKLELIHPQPHILGMFRKTQLIKLFRIHESVDEALNSAC